MGWGVFLFLFHASRVGAGDAFTSLVEGALEWDRTNVEAVEESSCIGDIVPIINITCCIRHVPACDQSADIQSRIRSARLTIPLPGYGRAGLTKGNITRMPQTQADNIHAKHGKS